MTSLLLSISTAKEYISPAGVSSEVKAEGGALLNPGLKEAAPYFAQMGNLH